MSKFAVIQLAGKQFKVQKGDKLTVDRLDQTEGKNFKVDKILMLADGERQMIGQPLVDKASVTLKLLKNKRSKKLRVGKFKAKSRYRRVYGHRQPQSVVEVVEISS